MAAVDAAVFLFTWLQKRHSHGFPNVCRKMPQSTY